MKSLLEAPPIYYKCDETVCGHVFCSLLALLPRRKRRKHCVCLSNPLLIYTAVNEEWAIDLVHDAVASGRPIRVQNVIDAYTRESLAIEVDTNFAGLRVTRVLDQTIAERGQPRAIRSDNGPELTSWSRNPGCLKGYELVRRTG
jgi:putative transposase